MVSGKLASNSLHRSYKSRTPEKICIAKAKLLKNHDIPKFIALRCTAHYHVSCLIRKKLAKMLLQHSQL